MVHLSYDSMVTGSVSPQVTGAYSMSGGDLRALLMLLRTDTLGRVPRKAGLLLRTMCHMAKHDGPSSFFDFAKPGAGIVRNSTLR